MPNRKNNDALPKEENQERISFQTGGGSDVLDIDYRASGDSVNEHKRMESANAHLAEEEIKQVFNNS